MNFEVGEVAIFKRTGEEVLVVKELGDWYATDLKLYHGTYAVERGDDKWLAYPRQLIKKPPKERQQTTTWDRCVWKPRQVSA